MPFKNVVGAQGGGEGKMGSHGTRDEHDGAEQRCDCDVIQDEVQEWKRGRMMALAT